LCISQSAVSHALQRLRLQLKDELFVRSGQKMLPTPYAEQIYQPIQMALLRFKILLCLSKILSEHATKYKNRDS
jgi:DNA-binding transcriptional LysR family regulator